MSHRWISEAGQPVLELLISWCNCPIEEATWESYDLLAEQFPHFHLEDKSFYRAGSNDTNPIRVYTRKKKRDPLSTNEEQINSLSGYWVNPLGQTGLRIWSGGEHFTSVTNFTLLEQVSFFVFH